ncbi:MAG TPA: 1,2-phenylacetyl-CoA epoxidase subunit PaaD [Bacteroidia bacterium]|jgi:ring-1,2-phenylacetyl-CoA epoxidase subunit PaaD|nr:1,2-phenylacetyl-CoA epoxidase subunit PaaD [Bacteroidia bacterium]
MNSNEQIWSFLDEVMDPEIPVLSILDLGIVRSVEVNAEGSLVTITPTYTGCPATHIIEEDIRSKLKEKGVLNFSIKTILSPAWTTDWISGEGRRKLKEYGIAPPEESTSDKSLLSNKPKVVHCPRCNSTNTEMRSFFGSTPCKSLYVCSDCKEPFDYFKCL